MEQWVNQDGIGRRVERILQLLVSRHQQLGLTKVLVQEQIKRNHASVNAPAEPDLGDRGPYERALGIEKTGNNNAKKKLGSFKETKGNSIGTANPDWRGWNSSRPRERNWQKKNIENIWVSLRGLNVIDTVKPSLDNDLTSWVDCLDDWIAEMEERAGGPMTPTSFGVATVVADKTDDYFTYYQRGRYGKVPFGGRDREIADLTRWLNDDTAASHLLLTAPAGRGKSALLLHWLQSLHQAGSENNKWEFVFTPISVRSKTANDTFYYRCLAERLAEVIGSDLINIDPTDPTSSYESAVKRQIRELTTTNKYVLIIIDGLDEALDRNFSPEVLKVKAPHNIRIIVSARLIVPYNGPDDWAKKLEWKGNVEFVPKELDKLSKDAVAAILHRLGAPLRPIVRDPDLLDQLARLIDGEPLAARFYLEDLATPSTGTTRITTDDLKTASSGFPGYFEIWMRRHHERELKDRLLQDVICVLAPLAFAYGPLSSDDIWKLVRIIYKTRLRSERPLLEAIERFAIGDGSPTHGYVLSHPLIAQFLKTEYYKAHLLEIPRGFARWCKNQLDDLNEEKIDPSQVPSYVVHFLRRHLIDNKSNPADLMAMTSETWRRAWEHIDRDSIGFTLDIQAVFEEIKALANPEWIAAKWRCALILSSIRGRNNNVPYDLVITSLRQGNMSIDDAVVLVTSYADDVELIKGCSALSLVVLPNFDLSLHLIRVALDRMVDPVFSFSFTRRNQRQVTVMAKLYDNTTLSLIRPPERSLPDEIKSALNVFCAVITLLIYRHDPNQSYQAELPDYLSDSFSQVISKLPIWFQLHVRKLLLSRITMLPIGFRTSVLTEVVAATAKPLPNELRREVEQASHFIRDECQRAAFLSCLDAEFQGSDLARKIAVLNNTHEIATNRTDRTLSAYRQNNDGSSIFEGVLQLMSLVTPENRSSRSSVVRSFAFLRENEKIVAENIPLIITILDQEPFSSVEEAISGFSSISLKIDAMLSFLGSSPEDIRPRIIQTLKTLQFDWLLKESYSFLTKRFTQHEQIDRRLRDFIAYEHDILKELATDNKKKVRKFGRYLRSMRKSFFFFTSTSAISHRAMRNSL